MRSHYQAPSDISCDGKDKLTAAIARKVAKRQPGGSTYHCLHCNAWHVGHGSRKAQLVHKRPRLRFNDEE